MKRVFIMGIRILADAVLILMITEPPLRAETCKKKVDHKGRDV